MDRPTDVFDEVLLAAAAQGDGDAYAVFYRRHLSAVLQWCLTASGNRELAADLTAEVFAAALASAKRYRVERGTARAWLFGIAHNKLRESLRRRRVDDSTRRRLGIAPIALTDDDLERVEELARADQRVLRLVGELPAPQREAIAGRVIDELSYPELAAAMRCSESVIRQRVSRGLASLRARLEER